MLAFSLQSVDLDTSAAPPSVYEFKTWRNPFSSEAQMIGSLDFIVQQEQQSNLTTVTVGGSNLSSLLLICLFEVDPLHNEKSSVFSIV